MFLVVIQLGSDGGTPELASRFGLLLTTAGVLLVVVYSGERYDLFDALVAVLAVAVIGSQYPKPPWEQAIELGLLWAVLALSVISIGAYGWTLSAWDCPTGASSCDPTQIWLDTSVGRGTSFLSRFQWDEATFAMSAFAGILIWLYRKSRGGPNGGPSVRDQSNADKQL